MIVATIRALKFHGGVKKSELNEENIEALEKGFLNLKGILKILLSLEFHPSSP